MGRGGPVAVKRWLRNRATCVAGLRGVRVRAGEPGCRVALDPTCGLYNGGRAGRWYETGV